MSLNRRIVRQVGRNRVGKLSTFVRDKVKGNPKEEEEVHPLNNNNITIKLHAESGTQYAGAEEALFYE
jgi:hypothetical protein